MALTIYRRHLDTCRHVGKGRRDAWALKCTCPIWVQGSLGGEYLRRSLDLTSWEAAQDRVRGWEASGEIGVVKTEIPDIRDAVERFFDDIKSRGLSEATIGKQNVLLRKQFLPWCKTRGFYSLKQINVDEITQFRSTWTDAPISKYKKQERLKGFFHFCVAREWMRTNPVAALKPIKVPLSPTLPFEEDQVAAILKACDRYSINGIYGEHNVTRLRALTLLMRYSGLRIGDAVTCARDRLVGSKLFLYQAKTGTPVYCPLPPVVVDALEEVKGPNLKYFFWTGNGKTHMFRDTFAVELLKHGVSLETVSMLLGHASIKVTEKHYKPWVKTLQDKLEADAMKAWPEAAPRKAAGGPKRRRLGSNRLGTQRSRKRTAAV